MARQRHKPGSDRALSALAAAGLSLLIHVLLIDAAMTSSTVRRTSPHEDGIGASAVHSDDESRMTVIFLDAPGTAPAEQDLMETIASEGKSADGPLLTIASSDPSLAANAPREDEARDTLLVEEDPSPDQTRRAMLFGRYLGQIQARIERAWLRPRSTLDGDSFECRVRVQQDRHGNVIEVAVQRCNGDADWQMSLVRAIERAAPLPAPPDPRVYVDLLQLSFHSETYRPDRPAEGFEPLMPAGPASRFEFKPTTNESFSAEGRT